MIAYNLIFWAGCPSGAPHAPWKSSGVEFLRLTGLFFPHLLLTGSWLSRELVRKDSFRTVPSKPLQFRLDRTKCCSQGQAPIHTWFQQIVSCSGMLTYPIQCAFASYPSVPLPESGSSHPFLASPDALENSSSTQPAVDFSYF